MLNKIEALEKNKVQSKLVKVAVACAPFQDERLGLDKNLKIGTLLSKLKFKQ